MLRAQGRLLAAMRLLLLARGGGGAESDLAGACAVLGWCREEHAVFPSDPAEISLPSSTAAGCLVM